MCAEMADLAREEAIRGQLRQVQLDAAALHALQRSLQQHATRVQVALAVAHNAPHYPLRLLHTYRCRCAQQNRLESCTQGGAATLLSGQLCQDQAPAKRVLACCRKQQLQHNSKTYTLLLWHACQPCRAYLAGVAERFVG